MVLLSVLWAMILLASLVAGALLVSRRGFMATRNRMGLAQARWAMSWCENLAAARLAQDSMYAGDSIALSNGSWCRLSVAPANGHLNINTADSIALTGFLGQDSLRDAIMDWRDTDDVARGAGCEADCYRELGLPPPGNRPFASPSEILKVRGIASRAGLWLVGALTVDGDGRVNVNAAPPRVLASLPGVSEGLALRIWTEARHHQLGSLDAVATIASPVEGLELGHWWTDLLARTTFERGSLALECEGGSSLSPAVARERLVVNRDAAGVTVLRRESW